MSKESTITDEQLNIWINEAMVPDLVSSDVFLKVAFALRAYRNELALLQERLDIALRVMNKDCRSDYYEYLEENKLG